MSRMESIKNHLTDQSYDIIINTCEGRVKKYGLSRSGSCKGCPYRYRGENSLNCCIFGTLPVDWRKWYEN